MTDTLILASGSPRRSELLTAAAIPFKITSHSFDESSIHNEDPISLVEKLSFGKADSVNGFDKMLVLGVDTIVVFGNMVLGKPKNQEEAEKFARMLSGRTHEVISGISLINRSCGIEKTAHAISEVTLSSLTDAFIRRYLEGNHWCDFAGGYAIQGLFSLVVERIIGSYSNIVGLPMDLLYRMMIDSGFSFQ